MITKCPHNQSSGQGLNLISCKHTVIYCNRIVWS